MLVLTCEEYRAQSHCPHESIPIYIVSDFVYIYNVERTTTHCRTQCHTLTRTTAPGHTHCRTQLHALPHTAALPYCHTLPHTATHCHTVIHYRAHCRTLPDSRTLPRALPYTTNRTAADCRTALTLSCALPHTTARTIHIAPLPHCRTVPHCGTNSFDSYKFK
jgi:hypothetical protein